MHFQLFWRQQELLSHQKVAEGLTEKKECMQKGSVLKCNIPTESSWHKVEKTPSVPAVKIEAWQYLQPAAISLAPSGQLKQSQYHVFTSERSSYLLYSLLLTAAQERPK